MPSGDLILNPTDVVKLDPFPLTLRCVRSADRSHFSTAHKIIRAASQLNTRTRITGNGYDRTSVKAYVNVISARDYGS